MENDKKITQKLNYLKRKKTTLKRQIFIYKLFTIPIFVFMIFITIIIFQYFKENLILGSIIVWAFWFMSVHYNYLYNEQKRSYILEEDNINNEIEDLTNFYAYIIACRHIESLDNGMEIYPDMRRNDSEHVIKQYKNLYEDRRILYEKNNI